MIGRVRSREGGFALVLVLWMLLLLSLICGSLLHEIRSERVSAAIATTLTKAALLADGAINRAILSLIDRSDPWRPQIDGTPLTMQIFGSEVLVSVQGEAGKIDLNAAPSQTLSAVFRNTGMSPSESDEMADRIVAWRSPSSSSSGDPSDNPYRDAGLPYGPRHGAFRSVGELRLVLGMTDALQAKVAPVVTVYSRNPTVDRGIANDEVLSILQEAGDKLAGGQQEARRAGHPAGGDRPPGIGESLTIRAAATVLGASVERVAVVQLGGAADRPYQVMSWQ